MDIDIEAMGKRLKQARMAAGLTQIEVVGRSDNINTTAALSNYERGENAPGVYALAELAFIYNTTTDYILFGAGTASRSKESLIRQFVNSVDSLGLSLIDSTDNSISIKLELPYHDGLDDFAVKWKKLRSVLDAGALEESEYNELIDKNLSKINITPNTLRLMESVLNPAVDVLKRALLNGGDDWAYPKEEKDGNNREDSE